MGRTQNYLVIPSLELQKWIDNGDIVSKEGNDNCFNIFVCPDHERRRWLYRNKGHWLDWTMYWNSLDPLEQSLPGDYGAAASGYLERKTSYKNLI